jgi:hypothetical protein
MGPIDIGPLWVWKTGFVLACVGALAVLGGTLAGVVYLVRHLVWIP